MEFLTSYSGPIIRINPYEVHIDDPEFYEHVYVSAAERKTDKWSWWVSAVILYPSAPPSI